MLTDQQIYDNKMKFLKLLTELNIDLTPLSKYLDSTDYFNKPASYAGFKDYEGGLCESALNLCYELGTLCEAYFPGRYSRQDIIKVSLFKEIYRAEMYEPYMKNVKDDATGAWTQARAWRFRETRPTFGDLSFSSYMIAKNFVDLNDEQIEAICMASSNESCGGDIHEVRKNYPLVSLTRMAEIAARYFNR